MKQITSLYISKACFIISIKLISFFKSMCKIMLGKSATKP